MSIDSVNMNLSTHKWTRLMDKTFMDEQPRTTLSKTSTFIKPYEIVESENKPNQGDTSKISDRAKNLAKLKSTSEMWIG